MKKSFILFALLAITCLAFAQQSHHTQWTGILSDQPETFRTQLISSSEQSIQVNVQVPGFYLTNVATPRGEANIVSMPKAVSTALAGEPNMPMTGIPVIIGDRARMDIRVVDAQYMDFEGIEVAPSKGDFSRQIDPATVPYTYGECYSHDAFFPASNIGLYEPYIVRDFRGQNMVVYPFAYNPVSKTLRVYYNMTVEMYKVNDKGENAFEARRSNVVKMDSDVKNLYQRHFINYEASLNRYTPLDEEGDLLIICYDSFLSAMTDFVNWKKTRGVNTTIVGTSTIGSSLTYSNLKTYIQNQYNANNNLTYVLLVGDAAQIPGYSYSGASGYTGLGDNPYGQVVGNDIYNDLFIGRFSAQTVAQVQTQVQRTITYERDLTTSATWCQKGEGIGKTEGNSSQAQNGEEDYEHIELIRGDLISYGYNTVYQDYASTSGYTCSATTISNHFNSGVGIANYCNHGDYQMWGVASYSNVHVNALTNENKLPFIWSTACYVGKYDNTSTSYGSGTTVGQTNDCFAEAWMHATNSAKTKPTGAIGVLMSYISQPWQPPMWGQDECVDILVESYSNNIKHTWGGTSINGIMGIFDHYSTSTAQAVGTYQAWVLYGDPSLMLRTKTPQAMTVTHSGVLPMGSSTYSFSVSNGNNALATITNANHDILGKATVTNGTATINISGNSLDPNEQLTLCVFGYNKVTYLGTITITGGTQYDITCGQPEHGTISAPEQAYAGATVTLTATPDEGYCLSSWNVMDANNVPVTVTGNTFIMPESSVTVSATFLEGLTITLASVENGNISADASYALQGTTINLTATPATGYEFNSWIVFKTGDINTEVTVTSNSFTMPDYPVTVTAIFMALQGGDVTIGSGTSTTGGNYLPTTDYYKYSLSQQIYTQNELGEAGSITAISFYYNTSTSSNPRDLVIYMKHTNNSAITTWQTQSSSNVVYAGTHTFNKGWNTITLTTPFDYNGTSNVLLTVDDNTGSWSTNSSFYTYSTGANRAICYRNDNTNPNPTSSVSVTTTTYQYNAQMIITKEVPNTDGYLSLSSNALSDFTYAEGGGPSEVQSIAVIGANLQSDLTINITEGFEVSSDGNTFASTLTLTPTNGNIRNMLFVRLAANLSQNDYIGTMTLVSGETAQSVSLSGAVLLESHWTYEEGLYDDNTAIVGVIAIDNVEQASTSLEVGAFCGTECRGTGRAMYLSTNQRYYLMLMVYGEANDVINFKLYDHEQNMELEADEQTYLTFQAGSYGTIDDPFVLNFVTSTPPTPETYTQQITLSEGWDWWSTPIELNDIDGLSILQDLLGNSVSMIKNQSSFSSYNNGNWTGGLTSISNEKMLMINANESFSFEWTGASANPSNHPITIVPGWNWIGFIATSSCTLAEGLADYTTSNGDLLKSQSNFATYSNGAWTGSVQTLVPGQGYMLLSNNSASTTFHYPEGTRTVGASQEPDLHFNSNCHQFAHTASIMASLSADEFKLTEDLEVAAFVNGQCRGTTKLQYVASVDQYVAFLSVSGEDGETVEFKVYADGEEYAMAESLGFVTDQVVGSPAKPMLLHLGSRSELTFYPNPAQVGETIRFEMPSNASRCQVEIFDLLGSTLRVESSTNGTIPGLGTSGVYTIKVTDENGVSHYGKLLIR